MSGRLERGLVASGDRVVRVAPGLTETSRRAVREPGKSDPIDATAIARAALREGIDTLPVAFLDEQAHEIRVLTDYRDQLVNERVRLVNRLRWHLVQIAPELEARLAPAGLDQPADPRNGRPPARPAAPQPAGPGREADPQADLPDLPRGARAARRAQSADRGSLPGSCWTSTAAGRSPPRSSSATPPAPSASRPTRASPGTPAPPRSPPAPATPNATGCTAAATASSTARSTSSRSPRARTDPATRAYLDRKHAEGKTKREAIRCLKRHLARRIWRLLYTTIEAAPPPDRTLAEKRNYRTS